MAVGADSSELDALDPKYLDKLVEKAILHFLDVDLFNKRVREEKKGRELIAKVAAKMDK